VTTTGNLDLTATAGLIDSDVGAFDVVVGGTLTPTSGGAAGAAGVLALREMVAALRRRRRGGVA